MAGFLSYGAGKALGYQHDYSKDMDRLYQREAYKAQVQAQKEQKASFYAQMMKEQTAAAPVNQAKLTDFYQGVASEVADFALKNPNWESDVMKSQQMYGIMDKYINNDIIREDKQVQQEWEKTKAAVNEGKITMSEYNELAAKYDDYKNNGGDPYVFLNPARKSMTEILKETNAFLEPFKSTYTDPETGKITMTEKVSDENIRKAAIAVLADPDSYFTMNKVYNAIDEKDRKELYPTLFHYTEAMIKMGEAGTSAHIGYDEMFKMIAKESIDNASIPMYHQTNIQLPLSRGQNITAHPANLAFTEFNNPGGQINVSGQGRKFQMYDANGEMTSLNMKGTLTALDGGGEIFTIGGVAYEKVPVAYSFTPSLETEEIKESDKPLEKERKRRRNKEIEAKNDADFKAMSTKLDELGWTNYGSTTPGIGDMIKGTKTNATIYHGSVIVPVDMSEASRMSYDKAFGLTSENLMKNAAAYNNDQALFQAAAANDIPTVSSLINQQYGRTAIKSKGMELGLNLDNLAWEPFSDDPYKFRAVYREDNKPVKDLIFDVQQNKVFDLSPR